MMASCQCGKLKAEVPGPTMAVVACHCLACQKRSGSPFGEAAYYPHDQVQVSGEARQFRRATDAGGHFDQYFCPSCGTTVYMRGTKNPDVTGIPIGLFDDARSGPCGRIVATTGWKSYPRSSTFPERALADRLPYRAFIGPLKVGVR